ncbi:Diaminopimelate epimerase [Pontiella desulfatans]|uniref:Diaminopimelate epimerase n=1 Tax=Pontiella desulfatans TaxID=2750659 RepID=A0A6C2U3W1_PONDE|nr:diaminopimelate epimerase [Pontiella desulfatans]VGO14527.1 Diaminopimelate epimerase [Pontiella desulfatans]
MKIPFTKMHGAGNDFIMVDDRSLSFPLHDTGFVRRIASRRIGIGCDGLLLIQPSDVADFRMRFINPDGGEQDMCGNGARCIARLAFDQGIAPASMNIETGAGLVKATVRENQIRLELTEPTELELDLETGFDWPVDFVNTGVPHAVAWVVDLASLELGSVGSALRHHALFRPNGANANFAKVEADGTLSVRTYERGVEAETLACGTGATAVAVLASERGWAKLPVTVHCAGGFDLVIDSVQGITTLTGGAEYVFDGEVEYGDRV